MTTTSFLTEEQQKVLAPDEDVMLEREGRDRRGIRRELAPTTAMQRGERFIEEGDGVYASAESDMPTGTTSVGEVLGNVDIVRYVGDQVRVPRMTHGMSIDAEDLEIDGAQEKVRRSKDVLMEMFDIQADLQFLTGITDEEGNAVKPGVFDWLDANIPTSNVIDASASTYDVPANIVVEEAYAKTTGEYADDGFDQVLWDHPTRAKWNRIDNNNGVKQASQWLDLGSDAAGVGQSIVNDATLIPDNIGLRTSPDSTDTLQFGTGFPSDTMYLIPDHGGDFYEMYEHPEPTLIQDPIRAEGGKRKYEYYWRAGHSYGFNAHNLDDDSSKAVDAVRIDNVSSLF